jgi:hypothetical protein
MDERQWLVLISDRKTDLDFFAALAAASKREFFCAKTYEQALLSPVAWFRAVVVLDVDHPESELPSCPYPLPAICGYLDKMLPAKRVFALSDKPLSRNQPVIQALKLLHYSFRNCMIRTYSASASVVLTKVIDHALSELPPAIQNFFPADTKVRKIEINHTEQRPKAVDALAALLTQLKIDWRLSAKVAQSVDELLMNAMFDAPRDKQRGFYRRQMPRTANFALSPKEIVSLEMAVHEGYVCISATDQFGSVDADLLLASLNRDFHEKDYIPSRHAGPGAGLGLYGITQSGLSLIIAAKPGERTMAALFFPKTDSYADFRKSFHFSACLV